MNPDRCKELCPLIETDDLIGGLWVPDDGVGDPQIFVQSLVKEALDKGVTIVEHCEVKKVLQNDGRVTAVDTSNGKIECVYFVNCAGFWYKH